MSKKKYVNDYELVVNTDESGRETENVVYRGEYFEISLDHRETTLFKKNCLLLLAAVVFLHICGGFVGNQGMYRIFVSLPYVVAFFPLIYMGEGILRLPGEKRRYRRDEVDLSFNRIKNTSMILLIILGAGVLGEITFLLFAQAEDGPGLELLYLALEAASASAVYLITRLQKSISILPSGNTDGHF
ncbi:MAG: hypothetical protein JXA25_19690 [Anaerolineales bacterium]|nr:hypothetical protein [Anaerolineales bacterium]